jgi:hypothetical protein
MKTECISRNNTISGTNTPADWSRKLDRCGIVILHTSSSNPKAQTEQHKKTSPSAMYKYNHSQRDKTKAKQGTQNPIVQNTFYSDTFYTNNDKFRRSKEGRWWEKRGLGT